MRGFAVLLAYLVVVSAMIGIGIVGVLALTSPIEKPSAPIVATAQPVKQAIVVDKSVRAQRKHELTHHRRYHARSKFVERD